MSGNSISTTPNQKAAPNGLTLKSLLNRSNEELRCRSMATTYETDHPTYMHAPVTRFEHYLVTGNIGGLSRHFDVAWGSRPRYVGPALSEFNCMATGLDLAGGSVVTHPVVTHKPRCYDHFRVRYTASKRTGRRSRHFM